MPFFSFHQAYDKSWDYVGMQSLLIDLAERLDIDLIYDRGFLVGTKNEYGLDSIVGEINGKLICDCVTTDKLDPYLARDNIRLSLYCVFYIHDDDIPIDINHPLLHMVRVYLQDSTIDEAIQTDREIKELQEIQSLANAYKFFIEQHPTGNITEEELQVFVDQYKSSMKEDEENEEDEEDEEDEEIEEIEEMVKKLSG